MENYTPSTTTWHPQINNLPEDTELAEAADVVDPMKQLGDNAAYVKTLADVIATWACVRISGTAVAHDSMPGTMTLVGERGGFAIIGSQQLQFPDVGNYLVLGSITMDGDGLSGATAHAFEVALSDGSGLEVRGLGYSPDEFAEVSIPCAPQVFAVTNVSTQYLRVLNKSGNLRTFHTLASQTFNGLFIQRLP